MQHLWWVLIRATSNFGVICRRHAGGEVSPFCKTWRTYSNPCHRSLITSNNFTSSFFVRGRTRKETLNFLNGFKIVCTTAAVILEGILNVAASSLSGIVYGVVINAALDLNSILRFEALQNHFLGILPLLKVCMSNLLRYEAR